MFGLGLPEMMIILVIALLIFGPKRLPEVGQNLGKAIRSFRDGAEAIKSDVEASTGLDEKTRKDLAGSLTLEDTRKEFEDIGKDLKGTVSLTPDKKDEAGKSEGDKEAKPAEVPKVAAAPEPKETEKEEVKT